VLPSATQVLAQLQSDEPLPGILSSDAALDTLARIIALQLLAACHTFLPASSASPIPLFQQRKGPKPVTALRLHSHYRFSPAAGHQARAPSESTSWPGLYTGPTAEDKLVEHVSRRRRSAKRSSEYVPHFTASGWTDGPPPTRSQKDSRSSQSRASSSSPEPGFFSRLICQASLPKNYRRKHNTMFMSRITSRQKRQKQSQSDSNNWQHSSQPVQRMPSIYRLRNTQSAPRIVVEENVPVTSQYDGKRHGSDPSIGSPLNYPFQIPEIRHVPDTPSPNWIPGDSVTGEVRACGRGDLIAAQDYFEEMPETPDTPHNPRRQPKHWTTSRFRHHYTGNRWLESPSVTPSSPPATLSPPAVSPAPSRAIYPSCQKTASDYFGEMYTGKNITHQTDDSDAATREHSDAGPEIEDDPRLQRMLENIVTETNEESSSDSDMESSKKRKGINETPATACEVGERFRGKTGDGFDHSLVKTLW
jgi:hypothetical protein